MPHRKPPKDENVLIKIRKCIEEDKYTISRHATLRQSERNVNLAEVLYVLKIGYEEKRKTSFDESNNVWKYAIRGKTKIEKKDVRVIVSFDEFEMLIITVMYVGGL